MKDLQIKELKNILKYSRKDNNGYRLTFKIERVAKTGLSRCLSIYVIKRKYKLNITHLLCEIMEETFTKEGYMRVYGCGMDMLFDMCYKLNSIIKKAENYKGTKKDSYNYLVSTYYDII